LPRQKFVDEGAYGYGLPLIFVLPQIRVFRSTTPTKTWEPAPNPLYSFKFPSKPGTGWNWESVFGSGYNNVLNQETIRGYDGTQSQGSTYFNHSFVIQSFDNNYNPGAPRSSSDAQSVWRLLLGSENWVTMSNHYDSVSRRTNDYILNSLEGFHDDIHAYLGSGPGAMDQTSTGKKSI
jgi:hypothetical protein